MNSVSTARRVIELEIAELQRLVDRVGDAFAGAVLTCLPERNDTRRRAFAILLGPV